MVYNAHYLQFQVKSINTILGWDFHFHVNRVIAEYMWLQSITFFRNSTLCHTIPLLQFHVGPWANNNQASLTFLYMYFYVRGLPCLQQIFISLTSTTNQLFLTGYQYHKLGAEAF